ncbi:MAG: hypothetical protein DHS20C01_36970 [marine bacterium B5-7]|nr:MAG: hypothetical protein DHS20C01_36970 [marine bacterium B5-7]
MALSGDAGRCDFPTDPWAIDHCAQSLLNGVTIVHCYWRAFLGQCVDMIILLPTDGDVFGGFLNSVLIHDL